MEDRLLVREEPLCALSRANEVGRRLVARLAEVEVAGKEVDHVVVGPVQSLGDLGRSCMEIAAAAAEKARVGDLLGERVVEDEDVLAVLPHTVEEAGRDKIAERLLRDVGLDAAQQRQPHAPAYDRGRL